MRDEKTYNLLIEFLTADLTRFLMRDRRLTLAEAVELLYRSEWYSKASDPATELYVQSALYNYELLKHELEHGTLR